MSLDGPELISFLYPCQSVHSHNLYPFRYHTYLINPVIWDIRCGKIMRIHFETSRLRLDSTCVFPISQTIHAHLPFHYFEGFPSFPSSTSLRAAAVEKRPVPHDGKLPDGNYRCLNICRYFPLQSLHSCNLFQRQFIQGENPRLGYSCPVLLCTNEQKH